MDLKTLQQTPPWEWPKDAAKTFKKALTDKRASADDRLIAADLAGDMVAINDSLVDALLAIVRSADEPNDLRAKAAISLGPVLEQANTFGFEDPDDVPITLSTYDRIQDLLLQLYEDPTVPKEVRRRVLEASVRSPQDWHFDALPDAYSSADKEWKLTAIFAMRWIRGFDAQILEALKSPDPEIHFEAVHAAGANEIAEAWPHVLALIKNSRTPKPLLIAAIEAVAVLRPQEAGGLLADLALSDDEDIAEAASEAISMAEGASGDPADEEEDEAGWLN